PPASPSTSTPVAVNSAARRRSDEVGLPCSSTIGSPSPTSTYAISLPRTRRRRRFWNGNAGEIFSSGKAEIIFAPPIKVDRRLLQRVLILSAGMENVSTLSEVTRRGTLRGRK